MNLQIVKIYLNEIKEININNTLDNIDKNNTDYNNYKLYITTSQLLKKYEMNLINENILYNLYPYSFIKLNNIHKFISIFYNHYFT